MFDALRTERAILALHVIKAVLYPTLSMRCHAVLFDMRCDTLRRRLRYSGYRAL